MDIINVFNERKDQYDMVTESVEVVTEFFGGKQKKEKLLNDLSEKSITVDESDLDKHEKEFEKTVNFIKGILKKEIPGVKFNEENITKNTKKINDEFDYVEFKIDLFDMKGENFKKYISKSKNEIIKNAENAIDCVDELFEDNINRVFDHLVKFGFETKDYIRMKKMKNGKEYISVYIGVYAEFSINLSMNLLVKK